MKKFFKFIWAYLKSIPLYGYIIGVGLLVLDLIFYYGAIGIISVTGGYAGRGNIPIIASLDNSIPFVPFFIIFYVLSYPHWVICFIINSKQDKDEYIDFLIGMSVVYIIGFILFVSYPTYLDRSKDIWLIKHKGDSGFFMWMWKMIVNNDGGIDGFSANLFPSYHCLISIYVYLGMHRSKNIRKGFKIFTLIMAILICMSTVFCKQHYFMDIIGALVLSLIFYSLFYFIKPGKRILEYRHKKKALLENKDEKSI